jgi:hypothetical protein
LDAIYREHAAHCARLTGKTLSPTRRSQLERERQDWLVLADQQRTWRAMASEERARVFDERPIADLSGSSR